MKARSLVAVFLLLFGFQLALADSPRVLPADTKPADRRLGALKHLNAYFPFEVPTTPKQWDVRAEELRRRILVATGMWPLPERTPMNPVIHGKVKRDGFTVERVYFESVPGFYVTGLLYRPTGKEGKRPAVLCPHGHGGRLQDLGAAGVKKYIATGAEKYEASGRYPKLARCVQLARMGCVVFIYDMIGYADSTQLSFQLAHRFAKQRPKQEGKTGFGLYSAQAEMRSLSIFGLQAWNSIRCLDFLCQLPDVDPQRIGVTGGSGGGTQTIVLGAVDERPIASFPQGMVSTAMQGGCTCENACLLRIGTGNVELAALFAPRPLAMTAANDWTKEMMSKGYPELKKLYSMLGVEEQVYCKALLHFPHNYNYVTRGIMYHWFNKHLKLGLEEPIVERDSVPLSKEQYTVWNLKHPQPAGGLAFEVDLMAKMSAASDAQIAAIKPRDATKLKEYRRVVGGAWRTIIDRSLPSAKSLVRTKVGMKDHGDYWTFTDLLDNKPAGEQLPVASFFPKKTEWNKQVVVWVDGAGKDGMFHSDGGANAQVRRLLDAGFSVIGADLLHQGEFLAAGESFRESRRVGNTREYAGFTLGYNHPVFVQRVHDVLTLLGFVANDDHGAKQVHVLGVNGGGAIAAAARAIAGKQIARTAIDTQGFRFHKIRSIRDVNFVPGVVKYGDLDSLFALAAPGALFITGDGGKLSPLVAAAHRAAKSPRPVSIAAKKGQGTAAAVSWLIQ